MGVQVDPPFVEYSHPTTEPLLPLKVNVPLFVFGQAVVTAGDTVPPTDAGAIVIVTAEEFAAMQLPLFTTALKYVVVVNAPIEAAGKVVLAIAISVTEDEKSDTVDFCHFTTLPTLPAKVSAAGVLPVQIV